MVKFADQDDDPAIPTRSGSSDALETSTSPLPPSGSTRSILRHRSPSFVSTPAAGPGDSWSLRECMDFVSVDPEEVRDVLQEGINRIESARSRAESWLHSLPNFPSTLSLSIPLQAGALNETYFDRSPVELEVCGAMGKVRERMELVDVWEGMRREERGEGKEEEMVDPWAVTESDEDGSESGSTAERKDAAAERKATYSTEKTSRTDKEMNLPITLPEILALPPPTVALLLASSSRPSPITPSRTPNHPLLTLLHISPSARSTLFPLRWQILEATPPTTGPGELGDVIPLRGLNGSERWRGAHHEVGEGKEEEEGGERGLWEELLRQLAEGPNRASKDSGVSAEPNRPWGAAVFHARIARLESLGLHDLALDWTKCGINKGWDHPDHLALASQASAAGERVARGTSRTLKEKEEELVLLVKMAYRPNASNVKWDVGLMKALDEKILIKGYMWSTKDEGIANDIKGWVVPFVRWRGRLAGAPDVDAHVSSVLHSWILELPLTKALAIFEASKATLPTSERVIRSDVDVVRMALAILYGSSDIGTDTTDRWRVMSRIFECMPMWDVSSRDSEEDREVTSTTLESLAAFVAPSTERVPGPQELLLFFQVLGFGALSKALDILDVHLECGEILSKWGVSAPLRVFLITGFEKREQTDWALRMARSAGAMEGRRTASMSKAKKDEYWLELLGDMGKLSRRRGEGAFGLLSEEEVQGIFFDGLLSSGNFQLAKKLLNPTDGKRSALDKPMSPSKLERLVLKISNEFCDNASTGNVHTGEMKLAYECLSVAKPSSAIRKQQEYITAVSKLSSYHLDVTPIQIRLTTNKLDLISLVLKKNPDAYKQRDTLMDLADKLGTLGTGRETAQWELTILGMVADAAIKAGDFDEACIDCELMTEKMGKLGKRKQGMTEGAPTITAWTTFLSLGTHTDFGDVAQRLSYIGRALASCPVEEVSGILVHWRRLEDARLRLEDAARHRRKNKLPEPAGTARKRHRRNESIESTASDTSNTSLVSERFLGSRTAARAARALNASIPQTAAGFSLRPLASATAHLPNILRPASGQSTSSARTASTERTEHERETRSPVIGDVDEIRQQARKALHRGVGWLLGADGEHEV